MRAAGVIRTVGHGTASQEELSAILHRAGVATVVDVRRFPGSRRHPHVGRDRMAAWLEDGGVGYRWIEGLGGRRRPDPGSPNVAVRNLQLRAYADHMASAEFQRSVGELLDVAASAPAAVMCSESVWWRCHRRMVADAAALLHGVEVLHLMPDGRLSPHPPTDGVRVAGDLLVYDAVA